MCQVCQVWKTQTLMVVSNIFYFNPCLGEMIQFDFAYFSNGLKPPTRNCFFFALVKNGKKMRGQFI